MAKLGTARTKKFSIGTAEVRIGPLSSANKLTQAHSIGLVDDVTLEVAQENVDLPGGFPRAVVDTAIVSQDSSVTATTREYSHRNLKLMVGEGVNSTAVSDVSGTLSAAVSAGGTSIGVTLTGAVAGDFVVVYDVGNPADVSVCRLLTAAGSLDPNTPLLFNYAAGAIAYLARHIPIGNVQETNYFSVQFLQQERSTGRPVGVNYWKASISSGMSLSTNAEDFASTEMGFKIIEPTFEEYDPNGSGDLVHLSDIIPVNPTGIMFFGGD